MSWGFVLLQNGKAPRRVTNVRDDKVLTSRFWRDSFEQRRCLVPASSFCEPFSDVKPATWHWFRGDEPRPLFAFPGIWKQWRGPLKKDGPNVDVEVYAFMTTEPNSLVSTINHKRMPVLLTDEGEFETWLTGKPEEAFGLVRTFGPEWMQIVQSGMEKQDRVRAS